ncbi:MAG: DUF4912 domain-containing protein [Pirellulales bacterium]|nr:DUF4912 domain-containing protein [Pirellulales bacterium]
MTPATLRNQTCKDLAQMAKKLGVPGWHAMRKDQLVCVLAKLGKKKSATQTSATLRNRKQTRKANSASSTKCNSSSNRGRSATIHKKTDPRIRQRIHQFQGRLNHRRDLGTPDIHGRMTRDRLVVMVRDPYWLHAYWELSLQSIERARVALAQAWHTALPVLRLFEMGEDGSAIAHRDIEIHGGVNNWYLDVQDPPKTFRLEIGYLSKDRAFYCLSRSNSVTTPPAGTSDALDENWVDVAENADRIYAMSGGYSPHGTSQELQELLEERLRRPMGTPMTTRYGAGAMAKDDKMDFAVDAELIVYGVSHREAHVTLKGEPVQLRPDGTFTVRLSMPERRQVIPVVASSADGMEQQTIILAVERNTKVMEPIIRDITQ